MICRSARLSGVHLVELAFILTFWRHLVYLAFSTTFWRSSG
ncbi:hypothetical protein HNO89_003885 [Sporosarcina luteola]|nr:hypothetical protein [Sporosarcina luteola]